jgi:hypothetical protein
MRIDGEQVRLSASDVANFLACRHLTRLDLLRARGVISPPHPYDAGFEDLVARGETHEKEVLQASPRSALFSQRPPCRSRTAAGRHGRPRECQLEIAGRRS